MAKFLHLQDGNIISVQNDLNSATFAESSRTFGGGGRPSTVVGHLDGAGAIESHSPQPVCPVALSVVAPFPQG